jgi:serine/threonine protein kinase
MDMALRTLVERRATERSQLEDQKVESISLDVARGLHYLHSKTPNRIIHRDVSSANVLLWIENGAIRRAKISDYDPRQQIQDQRFTPRLKPIEKNKILR